MSLILNLARLSLIVSLTLALTVMTGCKSSPGNPMSTPTAVKGGEIVIKVAAVQDENAYQAGKTAALTLKRQMGNVAPHTVIVTDCFDEASLKKKMLKGVCSVFSRNIVFGGSTYGSFTQNGCLDLDSVCLTGIGGGGISVSTALVDNVHTTHLTADNNKNKLEKILYNAGRQLADWLPKSPNDRLVIAIPDAHSPKNQFFVEGMQTVLGNDFPITGGSVNKNAGQTFIYYGGRILNGGALALMLSGDFRTSTAGRNARENSKVISTAKEAAEEALVKLQAAPLAAMAFNCAGRKGKLDNLEDELHAIQEVVGKNLPLSGCYCAGEIGPADQTENNPGVFSSGVGWHIMFTVIGR